jgi:hypothetical protein
MIKFSRIGWVEYVAQMLDKKLYLDIEGKSRQKPLGRSRRRWVKNIKIYLREVWIELIWLNVVTF